MRFLVALRQPHPGNEGRATHVESLLVPCLDAGSTPASSTERMRFGEHGGGGDEVRVRRGAAMPFPFGADA